jgi:hypothetical protein
MQAFSADRTHDTTRRGGFCRAGDILQQQHRDLLVSRQKRRQADWSAKRGRRETRSSVSPRGYAWWFLPHISNRTDRTRSAA